MAELEGGQAPPFPPAFLEFVELFNRGEYWESHEVLEGPWRANRSDFFQGLILLASAYVHAQRGKAAGIRKQMEKALRRLAPYQPHYMGIDVDELVDVAEACIALAEESPAGSAPQIPFVRLIIRPELVIGDEEECFGADAADSERS